MLREQFVKATVSTLIPFFTKHPDSTPTNKGAISKATRCPAFTSTNLSEVVLSTFFGEHPTETKPNKERIKSNL